MPELDDNEINPEEESGGLKANPEDSFKPDPGPGATEDSANPESEKTVMPKESETWKQSDKFKTIGGSSGANEYEKAKKKKSFAWMWFVFPVLILLLATIVYIIGWDNIVPSQQKGQNIPLADTLTLIEQTENEEADNAQAKDTVEIDFDKMKKIEELKKDVQPEEADQQAKPAPPKKKIVKKEVAAPKTEKKIAAKKETSKSAAGNKQKITSEEKPVIAKVETKIKEPETKPVMKPVDVKPVNKGRNSFANKEPPGGIYTVQIYATPSKSDAENWLAKIKKLRDARITTQTIRGKLWYRVRFGYYDSREKARAAALKAGYPRCWIDRLK